MDDVNHPHAIYSHTKKPTYSVLCWPSLLGGIGMYHPTTGAKNAGKSGVGDHNLPRWVTL